VGSTETAAASTTNITGIGNRAVNVTGGLTGSSAGSRERVVKTTVIAI